MGIISRITSYSSSKGIRSDYESILPEVGTEQIISKNIFQIALSPVRNGRQELSEDLISNQKYIREHNPEWCYYCLDNEQARSFLLDAFGETMLSYYMRVDVKYGAARADFLRYLLLYYYGGVYLDIKCRCTKPLDSVVPSEAFYVIPDDELWAHSEFPDMNGKFYFNAFIVAPKGHPLLRAIILEMLARIDCYNPFVDGVGWRGVVTTTGTYMYSRVINSYIGNADNADYVVANARNDYGYDNIFQGKDWKVKAYHSASKMTDYRSLLIPVISHHGRVQNFVNAFFLRLIHWYRLIRHL